MTFKSILRTWGRVLLGEIALFGPDLKTSLLGIFDDHGGPAPRSVPNRIAGDVGQAILVAQLISNGVEDVIELANFFGKKCFSSGALGNFPDLFLNFLPCRLEDAEEATAAREIRVEKSDDVKLNIAFLDLLDEFLVGIETVLVLSVGKNDDGFLRFVPFQDLIHGQINGIVQSRAS